jgi:poly(A) polymerase
MIKRLIQRLLGQSTKEPAKRGAASAASAAEAATLAAPEPAVPLGQRREFTREQHGINPDLLDANAVRVVRTLKEAGYTAYIVGGAVRDLIVGLRPKDFDVATDATPEQVKGLFRRAFIIGRRFRLVHVVFGRGREHETIEVSTFRAYLDASAAEQVPGNEKTSKGQIEGKTHVVDASGRVLRDNVWGPQIEDAARRDFTINAMYYDPVSEEVVDYHGGLEDARARVIRMIGDPATRYREDPVRIIRIVRFAAKLGFALEPATERPIREMTALLANVPLSRMFDEMVKLLQTGHALASLEQIKRHGLDRGVFPVLDAVLNPARPVPGRDAFVRLALQDTDRRVAEGRAVVPSFLLACLLWHDVLDRSQGLRANGEPPVPALAQAVDAVFDARIGDISGRGKLAADMREVWMMQPRFERRTPSSVQALIDQPRFRAGYDFLRLRADTGEVTTELADWWEDFHLGHDDDREAMVRDLRTASATRVRKPFERAAPEAHDGAGQKARPDPKPTKPSQPSLDFELPAAGADAGTEAGSEAGTSDSGAPKRRRRRRRKPGGAEGEAGGESDGAGSREAAPGAGG